MRAVLTILAILGITITGVGCGAADPCKKFKDKVDGGFYEACNRAVNDVEGHQVFRDLGGDSIIDKHVRSTATGKVSVPSALVQESCDQRCAQSYDFTPDDQDQQPAGAETFRDGTIEEIFVRLDQAIDRVSQVGALGGACSFGCQLYVQKEIQRLWQEREIQYRITYPSYYETSTEFCKRIGETSKYECIPHSKL